VNSMLHLNEPKNTLSDIVMEESKKGNSPYGLGGYLVAGAVGGALTAGLVACNVAAYYGYSHQAMSLPESAGYGAVVTVLMGRAVSIVGGLAGIGAGAMAYGVHKLLDKVKK